MEVGHILLYIVINNFRINSDQANLTNRLSAHLGVAPGYFITPMTQPFYDDPEHRAWIESRIPLHEWGTVADLAGPMLFLASSASDYITGTTIKVDGGWLAC